MAIGIILFVIALLILAALFYSVFCYAPSEDSRRENADRCVICGEIIPEGRCVRPSCEKKERIEGLEK